MKTAYHAGCLSQTLAEGNDLAARAVAAQLGVELVAMDWSCCGGAASLTGGPDLARLTGALNLAKAAEAAGAQARIATGCMACVRHLETASRGARDAARSPEAHPGAAVCEERGREVAAGAIHERLIEALLSADPRPVAPRPLRGVKLAAYYGCRAFQDGAGAPRGGRWGRAIEDVLEWSGATAVRWSGRGECNGGYLTLSRSDIVEERSSLILHEAREAGAQGLVITCGLCQFNLGHRPLDDAMPMLYVPQVIGVALGLDPAALGIGGLHPASKLLKQHGVL